MGISLMEIAKLVLDYLKVLATWPFIGLIVVLIFNRPIRALLTGLGGLVDRVKKVEAFGISAEIGEQLLREANPTRKKIEGPASEISLSVASGAYSTDYRAVILVAGISNSTDQPDQVLSWSLRFPRQNIELEPTPAPPNLVGGVPWWPSPLVKLPANELTQGSLFFRGTGVLADGLPEEPLRGTRSHNASWHLNYA
jgi:hypothetical protein